MLAGCVLEVRAQLLPGHLLLPHQLSFLRICLRTSRVLDRVLDSDYRRRDRPSGQHHRKLCTYLTILDVNGRMTAQSSGQNSCLDGGTSTS
jgi:hypothetical protein